MRMMISILAAVASIGAAGHADAAITIYTSQASFLAAVAATGVDTFNDLKPLVPQAASLSRKAGSYSYTVSDPDALYGAGKASDGWLTNAYTPNTITFGGFASTVRGAGANVFASGEDGLFTASPLGLTIIATDAGGTVTQSLVNATTTSFIGFTSTTGLDAVAIRVTVPGQPYWATVNNFTLGTTAAAPAAVPEPASWSLMILGFGAVGGAMRRRTARVRLAV